MNRTKVATGIALLIISSLVLISILGMETRQGYLLGRAILLIVAGIVLILLGLSSKKERQ